MTNSSERASYRSIRWLLSLSRFTRILFAGLFSIFVALALFPVIDYIWLRFFFSMETRVVPALIITGIALVMYLAGWQLIVGAPGERPPARKAIIWYFGVGLFAIALSVLMIIQGYEIIYSG